MRATVVGTRHEDQPPEHWAGPESLDPTPVWKQYLLVGLSLLVLLAVVVVVAYAALAVRLVTPPAVVPGGRVVLAVSDVPQSLLPRRFGPPLVEREDSFWITRPAGDDLVAIREVWSPSGDAHCSIGLMTGSAPRVWVSDCDGKVWFFGARGEPIDAPRGLDRYLVSVEGDRVVVNTGHVIYGTDRTPASPSPSR